MVLSDAPAKAYDEERQWARDPANEFDPTTTAGSHNSSPATLISSDSAADKLSTLEENLHRLSCASEFKYRKRPAWLYLTGGAVTTSVWFGLLFTIGRVAPINGEVVAAWLFLVVVNTLTWHRMWQRAIPVCPNCRQNIRTCPADYCHVCGRLLRHKRCADCGVDNSWIGWLQPGSNGSFRWIQFCPGCGVELNTSIPRWWAGA